VSASERFITNAIVAALQALEPNVKIGDGEQPAGPIGWQGTPGQARFIPSVVVHPLPGGVVDGSLGAPHTESELVYQLSVFGGDREQCQGIVDAVEPMMLALRPAGVYYVDVDLKGGARRDDPVQPPLWQAVPRFRFYTTS